MDELQEASRCLRRAMELLERHASGDFQLNDVYADLFASDKTLSGLIAARRASVQRARPLRV